MAVKPAHIDDLIKKCDPKGFSFSSTKDLKPLTGCVGQERAMSALEFGLGLRSRGYNIFVLGEEGTGKMSTVRNAIEEKAKGMPVPDDWCYVNSFRYSDKVNAIRMPSGTGLLFKAHMEDLVETLKRDIPKVFESKDYESHRNEIYDSQQVRTKVIFDKLERDVRSKGFVLKKSASGLTVLPAKDGKAIKDTEFDSLTQKEKDDFDKAGRGLQDRLGDAIREIRDVEKDIKNKVGELDRDVAQYVLNPLINDLMAKFKELPEVVDYINEVRDDILDHIDEFMPSEEVNFGIPGLKMPKPKQHFKRYEVNLFVDNSETKGAPVVFEDNPTYYNLFGKVEHSVEYGVATTDFTMIKSGSLQKANGGYLVLNALDVLRNVFVYDMLKKALKKKEVTIEDVWEQYRLMTTESLKPEALPLEVKIILVGAPNIYYALYNIDKEYRKLFKVKSDFDNVMPRDEVTEDYYACFIASKCEEHDVLHFDKGAVARVVEFGSRFSGNQSKLTARFALIEDIVVEASHFASLEGRSEVSAKDVDKAYDEKNYRNSKIDDKIKEFIAEDSIMISTDGEAVGQLNGIAVLNPGDYSFGKPSRITAKTFLGDSGAVNIESEVKKSGKIYNKAHLIAESYLEHKFGVNAPVIFSASLCFEQLYEEIEGDSATCAEYYALTSSLSGLPLKQGIAVTGSMNQMGEVQPIGGANEKIEGFFDVCSDRGLTGEQGVIIPKRNLKNLMLKKEVLDAVENGKFHIYPIEDIDDGLEILTGLDAGKADAKGEFKKGTVNGIIQASLSEFTEKLMKFKKNAGNGKVTPKLGHKKDSKADPSVEEKGNTSK